MNMTEEQTLDIAADRSKSEQAEDEHFIRMRYDDELNMTLDMLDSIHASALEFTRRIRQSERN